MATSSLEGAVTSANHLLVKDGWCWSYRKYTPGDGAGRVREVRGRGRDTSLGEWHAHGGVVVQPPAVDYVEGSDSLGHLCDTMDSGRPAVSCMIL